MDPVTIQDVFAVIEKTDTEGVSLPHATWVLMYKFVGAALAEGRAQAASAPQAAPSYGPAPASIKVAG